VQVKLNQENVSTLSITAWTWIYIYKKKKRWGLCLLIWERRCTPLSQGNAIFNFWQENENEAVRNGSKCSTYHTAV